MMTFLRRFIILSLVFIGIPLVSFAQDSADSTSAPEKLIIGTKPVAPFVMQGEDGKLTGISIDLWEAVAREAGFEYEFRVTDLEGLLNGVRDSTYDAGIAALTITPEREEVMDFSHQYYQTGLGIAISSQTKGGWFSAMMRLISPEFMGVVALLLLLLLAVGAVTWLVERKRNPEHFGGGWLQGIGSGFWWSAVTMTTVGYGDKAPVSLGGRLLGLVWMFAGIIIISSFTAAITTALTVSELEHVVEGPEDLPDVAVGSVAASTSAQYLEHNGIAFAEYANVKKALAELEEGNIQAVVYDAPVLRYLIREEHDGKLKALERTFDQQYYGIALPEGSPIREKLNIALLEVISHHEWRENLVKYLGSAD